MNFPEVKSFKTEHFLCVHVCTMHNKDHVFKDCNITEMMAFESDDFERHNVI